MKLILFFCACICISSIVIHFGMLMAGRFDIMDHPGDHKQHDASTPFVGGFGLIAVVIATLLFGSINFPQLSSFHLGVLALGSSILFATGFADDMWRLCFKTRFLIQALVATAMVMFGGVELDSLGELVPGVEANLGVLSIPFTIFATIGLINALNMIDGIDGLSGSLSFISLAFTAAVVALAQNGPYLVFIVAVMGGIAGFLYFNLRYPSNKRARVFLGDNGSMLLGFIFAWLFIALSQGEQAAMTPVTALWLFGVPLLDTVGVMLRRIWLGKSPFHADRNHLHHLFIRAGFRVSDTVWIVSILQLALGAIGIAGLRLSIPEPLMFSLFLLVFAGYFYVIVRPWRFVPNLRRASGLLGLPSVHARGVFIGYFDSAVSRPMLKILSETLGDKYDCHLSLHRHDSKSQCASNIYALIEVGGGSDEVTVGEIRRQMARIKARLSEHPGVRVRLFMHRSSENDRRANNENLKDELKKGSKREKDRRTAKEDLVLDTKTIRCGKNDSSDIQSVMPV